jgi:membrane protease YdiL (CAAX protease family)
MAGLVVWLVAPTLFLRPAAPAPGQPVTTSPAGGTPSLRELVVVNATIPVVAFIVLAVGDLLIRPRLGQRLGFDLRSFPRGLAGGVVGIVFAMPIVYCAMILSELAYRQLGYRHPNEHDLLRAMGETPDWLVKYLAIAAAVAVAPLWEELLFRGHIQTLIRAALVRLREAGSILTDVAVPPARAGETLEHFATAPHVTVQPAPRAHAFEAIAAALMTAMLFAGVHQPWTWPPIFVLAVCLGIAYERTGNLWVPVVMHASFNTLMTTYFLLRGMTN